MAKRLSKTLWYGTGLDTYGKPLLPPVATNESDLNGLHRGELFMHLDKDNVTLWALSSNNEVVQIAGKQGEIDIDLSDYLLKSTWDKVWELRKDNNGVEYIYSKLPVVTRYGITMYADNGEVDIESIYAGLPIDRQTLIWKDGVLMVNPELDLGGGGGIDENELRDYLTRNDYAKKSDITTALNGYATTSSLNAVSTKLNDFLEGSDTDTVINKWKELETFLSGLTESDNLATILTGKADKSYVDTNFVTIAGTEDVTGLHNFVNGLKVGGIELIQKNGNAFLKGSLVVEGGITMYGDGEGGSSVPLYSTLGLLRNVDESNDAVASVDRVLFQSAGSNVWSWKALSEIGGGSSGGGSVSGDYLPLSGGTITGNLLIKQPVTTPVVGFIGSANSGTSYYYYGYLGFETQNNPIFMNSQGSTYSLLHAGNYSSYALPLSGGKLSGDLILTAGHGIVNPSTEYWLLGIDSDNAGTIVIGDPTKPTKIRGTYLNVGGHVYLTGADSTSSTANTTQIVFGTPSDNHVCLTSNNNCLIINPTTSSISGQVALYADATKESYIQSSLRVYGDLYASVYFLHGGSKTKIYDASMYTWDNVLQINKTDLNGTYIKSLLLFDLSGEKISFNTLDVEINKNIVFQSSESNPYIHLKHGGNDWYLQAYNNSYMYLGRGSTRSLRIDTNGNVLTAGGITMYSDQRKKTILNNVELSLQQIANAPLIEHYYNSDQAKTTHVGSIAQYWAGLNDWFCKLDNEGYYTMEIQNAALASAISIARHLEKYESKTDKKIRQLKKRISQLEDELELLKKGV